MLSRIASAVNRASASPFASAVRSATRKQVRFVSSTARKAPASAVLATVGGATVATIALWSQDSKNVAVCLSNAEQDALAKRVSDLEVEIAGKTNAAFVFIKPHACNDKVKDLVRSHLAKHGIRVTGEGTLSAKQIDEELLIDTHYGAIASKAVKLKPSELNVPDKGKEAFKTKHGLTWENAVKSGKVLNAKDACAKLRVDGAELENKWRGADLIKFGGGFYCGKVDDIFIINGFYMSMRSAYTTPPAQIHYFTVQWPTDTLSWESFRGTVLGATNPKVAATGSVRRIIFETWQSLGLASVPNVGDNGVHASASPFEGMAERANWLKAPLASDPFGRGLLAAGVPESVVKEWCNDPQVKCGGKAGSLFDLLEDMDADACLAKAKTISK